MKQYDFTTILDRVHHDSIAADLPALQKGNFAIERNPTYSILPMWVADMNFAVPPELIERLQQRLTHPTFGYFQLSDEYYDAIIQWQKHQHQWDVDAQAIGYEHGVLGGVVNAINVLASKGDHILVHSPTYVGFTNSLENQGYHLVLSPLVLDKENIYRMDYQDMEEKIIANHIHVAILCSPHNPTGRVWEKEELEKAYALFEKHHVFVISDEIWSDFILYGHHHIPSLTINEYAKEHTVSFYAPSKTFNLAGLVGSYHIVLNSWLKDRIQKEASLTHYNNINVLSMHALIGAYQNGSQWLVQLLHVLEENMNLVENWVNQHSGISLSKPQGTYLMWIHFDEYLKKHHQSMHDLLQKFYTYGVYVSDGGPFHDACCIRMNVALPTACLIDALQRIDQCL